MTIVKDQFTLETEAYLESYIIDPMNQGDRINLINERLPEGTHYMEAQLSSYRNGIYYLINKVEENIYFETILKQ